MTPTPVQAGLSVPISVYYSSNWALLSEGIVEWLDCSTALGGCRTVGVWDMASNWLVFLTVWLADLNIDWSTPLLHCFMIVVMHYGFMLEFSPFVKAMSVPSCTTLSWLLCCARRLWKSLGNASEVHVISVMPTTWQEFYCTLNTVRPEQNGRHFADGIMLVKNFQTNVNDILSIQGSR